MLVVAQLGAWWTYRRVERARLPNQVSTSFEYERIDGGVHEAPLQRPDGTWTNVRDHYGQPLLVHFWATWCAPCRSELPKLFHLGREGRVRVLLVSTDESWPVVDHFFSGEVPNSVLLDASGKARRAFGVSSLPDTYLVGPSGSVTARFHGPRDWADESVRRELLGLTQDSPARRAR